MDQLLFLFDWQAERFYLGNDLLRYYVDSGDSPRFVIELTDAEENFYSVCLKCHSDDDLEKVRDRICESALNHPGIIDLRGLELSLTDLETED